MRFSFLLGVLLVATSTGAEPLIAETETAKWLPNFACRGGRFGLRLPATYERVARLAPLIEERIEMIEEEPGYTITRKDLHFPGLVLGVVVPSNDPNGYLISGAYITDSRWKSLAPFSVGQSLESARRRLGKPAALDRALRASYGGDSSSIAFETDQGVVKGIIYNCYTG